MYRGLKQVNDDRFTATPQKWFLVKPFILSITPVSPARTQSQTEIRRRGVMRTWECPKAALNGGQKRCGDYLVTKHTRFQQGGVWKEFNPPDHASSGGRANPALGKDTLLSAERGLSAIWHNRTTIKILSCDQTDGCEDWPVDHPHAAMLSLRIGK